MTEILEGYRKRDPENGLIFPWYTWPCLEWLKGLDLMSKMVFEYGVGDSTHWYRSKGAICYGVDIDKEWANKARADWETDKDEYIYATIAHYWGDYDLIAIDGHWRDDCTENALNRLKPGGYLFIDNFHQPSVEPNIWTQTDKLIEGMPITIYKQPGHVDWQTAVITKP